MSVPLTSAVEEAGQYLDFFQSLDDRVTVQQLAGYPWPYLTLGSLRAMHGLAKDVCDTAAECGVQDVDRALGRPA